jgi:hypothetical protein
MTLIRLRERRSCLPRLSVAQTESRRVLADVPVLGNFCRVDG